MTKSAKKPEKPAILWFRQDLRLNDNPALDAAVRSGVAIVPLLIMDDETPGVWKPGAASRWWLHHSLKNFPQMVIRKGKAEKVLPDVIRETGAGAVYWNRCYEPHAVARDSRIKERLKTSGIEAESFKASLLHEPWEIRNKQGGAYKVYTPFSKTCLERGDPDKSLPAPKAVKWKTAKTLELDELELLPKIPWDKGFYADWKPGETGALERLDDFLENGIHGYAEGRDFPGWENVSRLSPYLHWGNIGPRQVWNAVRLRQAAGKIKAADAEKFLKEILWREFSYHLLYEFPNLPEKPLDSRFEKFAWKKSSKNLKAWQHGQTGYPIVDAGMRQLWQTGWMHNRVRMIVASFLVKDLLIPWQAGEAWFWDTLVDADLGNNAASWQWVAGCGADAAPFFRIFNPVTQGQKFDPDGSYVRRFVPEIAGLTDKYIHCPWEAPSEVLKNCGIILGKTYPQPIVNHGEARQTALAAFERLKT